ncbi:MAG: hypothetical protein L0K86_03595 [Actinomycetia bacterium]|nr:hypothetical protein [Actinomycetes bacterium]
MRSNDGRQEPTGQVPGRPGAVQRALAVHQVSHELTAARLRLKVLGGVEVDPD